MSPRARKRAPGSDSPPAKAASDTPTNDPFSDEPPSEGGANEEKEPRKGAFTGAAVTVALGAIYVLTRFRGDR